MEKFEEITISDSDDEVVDLSLKRKRLLKGSGLEWYKIPPDIEITLIPPNSDGRNQKSNAGTSVTQKAVTITQMEMPAAAEPPEDPPDDPSIHSATDSDVPDDTSNASTEVTDKYWDRSAKATSSQADDPPTVEALSAWVGTSKKDRLKQELAKLRKSVPNLRGNTIEEVLKGATDYITVMAVKMNAKKLYIKKIKNVNYKVKKSVLVLGSQFENDSSDSSSSGELSM